MKALNWMIGALLLSTIPQVSLAKVDAVGEVVGRNVKQQSAVSNIEGQLLFNKAYEAYVNAQVSVSEAEVSKIYASAIANISKAAVLEPWNSDYLLLGSQIWRGKGGISYAKSYFAKAETVLKQRLEAAPKDIAANLDYAIACYAGDVRFWGNYQDYVNKSQNYAKKTIELCDERLKKVDSSDLLRVKAMANLVLGRQEECKKLLSEAKRLDTEDDGFSIFKLFASDDKQEHKTDNIFYCDLYDNTVDKQQWFWPVHNKNIDKEFLLYYMTDEARNSDL